MKAMRGGQIRAGKKAVNFYFPVSYFWCPDRWGWLSFAVFTTPLQRINTKCQANFLVQPRILLCPFSVAIRCTHVATAAQTAMVSPHWTASCIWESLLITPAWMSPPHWVCNQKLWGCVVKAANKLACAFKFLYVLWNKRKEKLSR